MVNDKFLLIADSYKFLGKTKEMSNTKSLVEIDILLGPQSDNKFKQNRNKPTQISQSFYVMI